MYNNDVMNILEKAEKFLSQAQELSDRMFFELDQEQGVLLVKNKDGKECPSEGFYVGEATVEQEKYTCFIAPAPTKTSQ